MRVFRNQVASLLAATLLLLTSVGWSQDKILAPQGEVYEPLSADCDDCEPWCNLCPCRYVVVEGLLMDRNNQAINQPLVINLNTQQTLYSAGNLNPDLGAGFRIYGGMRLNECWGFELGYFGLFGQSANASVILEDQLTTPGDIGLGPVNNFFGADRFDIAYTSQIQGAEANWVLCNCDQDCHSVEWLAGFRYLNLSEMASLTSFDSLEGSSTYRVRTQNHLFGAQVGSRLRRCYGQWSLEGTGKAGIFGNDATQNSDAILDFPNNFVFRPATSASQGQVAFVGELNLSAIYQISQVWGLRAGYNLLWVEGVALAPDQFDFSNTPTSGTAIASNGGVFMHGLSAGVEARW